MFYLILRLETLDFYIQFYNDIPSRPGIYYWSYWPFKDTDLKQTNFSLLVNKLIKFSSINLNQAEKGSTGYKFFVEIVEKGLDNDRLGLSEGKFDILLNYLKTNELNRKLFLDFLKKIIFNKPFYVGKALNLRSRLKQHFERSNSFLLNELEEFDISFSDIIINFEVIDEPLEPHINSVFEELAQRILKPALVKRPG